MANSAVVAEAWAMCEAAFLLYSLHARPVIFEEDLTSHFPWEISSTCHEISEYLGYRLSSLGRSIDYLMEQPIGLLLHQRKAYCL